MFMLFFLLPLLFIDVFFLAGKMVYPTNSGLFLACGWYDPLGRVENFEMCHLRSLGRVANFKNEAFRNGGTGFDFLVSLTCCTCCRMIIRGGWGGVLTPSCEIWKTLVKRKSLAGCGPFLIGELTHTKKKLLVTPVGLQIEVASSHRG